MYQSEIPFRGEKTGADQPGVWFLFTQRKPISLIATPARI